MKTKRILYYLIRRPERYQISNHTGFFFYQIVVVMITRFSIIKSRNISISINNSIDLRAPGSQSSTEPGRYAGHYECTAIRTAVVHSRCLHRRRSWRYRLGVELGLAPFDCVGMSSVWSRLVCFVSIFYLVRFPCPPSRRPSRMGERCRSYVQAVRTFQSYHSSTYFDIILRSDSDLPRHFVSVAFFFVLMQIEYLVQKKRRGRCVHGAVLCVHA